jgi:hypothetical protein
VNHQENSNDGSVKDGVFAPQSEEVSEQLSDFDYREFHRLIQEMALAAYPNPERTGCPGRGALEEVASVPLSSRHPLFQQHVSRCSPCLQELLEIRGRNYVRKRRSKQTLWSVGGGILALSLAAAFLFLNRSRSLTNADGHQPPSVPPSVSLQIPRPTVSLFLLPGLSRGARANSAQTLQLPPRPSTILVSLRLQREDPGLQYDAIVTGEDGRTVQLSRNLRPKGRSDDAGALELEIRSETLNPGLYIILLLKRESGGKTRPEDAYTLDVIR